MADIETQKAAVRKSFGVIRSNAQKLFSAQLPAAQRIETRNAMIGEFDQLKKIFKQMNKIDGEQKK